MTEKVIRDCAAEFAKELSKYATKLDISSWREPTLYLKVSFTKEHGPKLELAFQGQTYGGSVKHTSLGLLMDEVYRRELFDDKAQLSTDSESAALRSLTHQPSNTRVDPNADLLSQTE